MLTDHNLKCKRIITIHHDTSCCYWATPMGFPIIKPDPNFNTLLMKTASHNALIYEQDIFNNHQLLFIKVVPIIDNEMIVIPIPRSYQRVTQLIDKTVKILIGL